MWQRKRRNIESYIGNSSHQNQRVKKKVSRNCYLKKFEDTKGVIRSCTSEKNRQCNGQKKKGKKTNTIHKTLQRKLNTELH